MNPIDNVVGTLNYKNSLLVILSITIGCFLGTLLHESGHILAALLFNSQIEKIRIGPFLQIFPCVKVVDFNVNLGEVIIKSFKSEVAQGVFEISGSGLNALISVVGLFLLHRIEFSKKITVIMIISIFILAWDIISYSFFPIFGLPHWIIIGGIESEPLNGAELLSIPNSIFYLLVIIFSIIVNYLVFREVYCIWTGKIKHNLFYIKKVNITK